MQICITRRMEEKWFHVVFVLSILRFLIFEDTLFYCMYSIDCSGVHILPKIRPIYSKKWNCAASFPIPTFMYLWAIYIFQGSVCLFGCSKIDRPILGIYKSLTDTWPTEHCNSVWEITWPLGFMSHMNTLTCAQHLPALTFDIHTRS